MLGCRSGQIIFTHAVCYDVLSARHCSFMKDLATLRNPRSRYTFMSYLHSQGRLISFINRGSTIPTRKEYSDYLSWAAAEVQANGVDVLYGHEIIDIRSGPEDTVAIQYRNLSTGEETVVKTSKS